MSIHERAGQHALPDDLVDLDRLLADYYDIKPDPASAEQAVSFGTSGHRGTSGKGSFNENHILAVTRAVAEYRRGEGITGPLFMGMDTHALSGAALRSALGVLAAEGVTVVLEASGGYTPTPAVSRAILHHNVSGGAQADGIVITPSHNPPEDGGFKYNPPSGGPADTVVTDWIQERANELLREGLRSVRRLEHSAALAAPTTHRRDLQAEYVQGLAGVVDMDAIRGSGLKLGVDPLGGASVDYWRQVAEDYGLDLEVVNASVDGAFSFMTLDHDGRIRMDCSSPYAMAGLLGLKDRFDVAFANDPDADRHGIVTPAGLMNPNHYLAAAVQYLFSHRPGWPADAAVGKTLVSSSIIDRVVSGLGRRLYETPVGFKWFVDGLLDGSLGFGGEESAGASFLAMDGRPWSTDKDGLIMCLLAAEMTAVTGSDPAALYAQIEAAHGSPAYTRVDAPADAAQRTRLARLDAAAVQADTLAGDPVTARLTNAPGNGAAIGGLKVTTQNGWFAARPSGTEDIYKIYAESLAGAGHLDRLVEEAKELVSAVLAG